MQTYSSLHDAEQEESGVLFHISEPSRARWNHIQDLDKFFSRLYKYHQGHGFLCMLMQEILELIQFVFVVAFTTFLVHGINYPVLFNDEPEPEPKSTKKIKIPDCVFSPSEFVARFTWLTCMCLFVALIAWMWRLMRGVYNLVYFWDIKQFYNSALGFADNELENLTWHQVQLKIREVQIEQQMCIHKSELTDLDIYHRILRKPNYLVAMTNKGLIPPRLKCPIIGEVVYWTIGLKCNLQLLMFWVPGAPFVHPWQLREEYRKSNARHELARQFGRHVLWLAIANLLLSPLVFLWQIVYTFFSYAEAIKREPGSLGIRGWSLYGRLYLRHFNELDHELQARLCRAHRPATRYLSSFTSPLAAVIAKNLAFMCGAIVAAFIALTLYDEDVLYVEHLLSVATICGAIVAACRGLIPDETIAYCPETLLANVLVHTNYLPNNWKGNAHTARVRSEFQQLFQYRIVGLLEELVSPILTPYILWRHVYPRSLDIVDFYRNFTVSVVGVGDVCSFAQMDVRKHGNPEWQIQEPTIAPAQVPDQYTQAEAGKTELSLLHFTLTNPSWKPPAEAQQFVQYIDRESSVLQPQTSGDYLVQAGLDDSSLVGNAFTSEGPISSTVAADMSLSTMYLHDRHYRQFGRRMQIPTAFETTPLLSTMSSQ